MSTHVTEVRIERRRDGHYADVPRPRLTWLVETDTQDWHQSAAELRLDGEQIAQLETSESVLVDWPFAPLSPRARHRIEVRVTGSDGQVSEWSDPVEIRATFLGAGEWQADFIELAAPEGIASPGLMRTEFEAAREVTAAVLYATAQGVYQVSINGRDVDDAVLKPGWTSYQYRIEHECTDVTELVRQGENAIGVRFAGCWYTEEYGFHGAGRRFYGEQPAVAAQLHLTYTDGTTEVVATGPQWKGAATGPLVSSSLYHGERIDARRVESGWDAPGFDDHAWPGAQVRAVDVVPEAMVAEPVRRTEELSVREVITTPSGRTVLDFGQNLVGRLRVRVTGPAGHVITLRHAEVLEHGELGTRPLREAKATDHLVLSGGEDVFEPEFTFHGFRYAEVGDWPGEVDPAAVTAVVITSDMRRTGWFESSHELVNRLHENVVWGMRGNFVSVPTDCPQRNERLGWTGDIQVFSPTASTLFDSHAFLTGWLRDVAAEQAGNGGVCGFVIPQVLEGGGEPAAAWGDATTVVPLVLYERFGDLDTLRDHFPSMKAWADVLLQKAGRKGLWEGDFQFGDWLDPDSPPAHPGEAKTDKDLVATAHVIRSARLVARAAGILGHEQESQHYAQEADRVLHAFHAAFVEPGGRMSSDTQTAYAMAIVFDLVDEETAGLMGDRLAELVAEAGDTIGTGFVGTPIISDALTRTGHAEVAGKLLLQTKVPSWLYAVTMGATTVWERWDSMLPDGTINPGQMTSFNHYAFGAVADWLYRSLAGLAPAAPGYRKLRIAPTPVVGIDHATARHETPYGMAESSWRIEGGEMTVRALIPANTTATIELPGRTEQQVGSGTYEFSVADPR
ncbi:alpha-L-rhamnosidase [Bogoriella caseilytica]|uniref:alpha-L-rhamnosidase n=1 Tax=Bogoriella caseilytica TaxID=56055 RepID=A0A3N2BBC7_9MICO|nr:alpha-L-rhamnosidase [Bogoriella caseilytica]ROR72560.1 alpha-L-rhamnosidase [Bogoriella caseilytica]